jgi:tetratricopeptide (TPR) repeat protein
MTGWPRFVLALGAALVLGAASPAWAEGNGQADLDEALRVKVLAEGLSDLNKVIELLESALDKGLDVENSDFAEQVLSESLFERASQLTTVLQGLPEAGMADPRMARIRALAVSDLRRVATYDEPPAEALSTLAELLVLSGDEDEAAEARDILTDLIDGEGFAELPAEQQANSLALRAALQEEPADALADFQRAIELNPDDAEYRLKLAQFQFQNDDVDAALAEIARVVETTPDQVAAYLLQSQILRAVKRYDEALQALDKVVELAPESIVPHQFRGEIYREMNELDKAIEAFTQVLNITPKMELALIRRAETYLLAGKLTEALADVDALLAENRDLVIVHGLRAQILGEMERYGEAIDEMKLLARELPGQPDVRMHLAAYYLMNEQPLEAIEEYNGVLESDADNFLALRSRGDAYLNVGDHKTALVDFERALTLEADDSSLLNNLAWVLATSPDDDVRDGQRAIELATKACEITEYKAPHILSTLAAAYAETGNFETAREWSQKAVDFNDPEHGEQLAKELASYEAEQPWRERQTQGVADEENESNASEESDDREEEQPVNQEAAEESEDSADAVEDDAPIDDAEFEAEVAEAPAPQ